MSIFKKIFKRKQGDYEIRILPDGRLVMVAPDQALTEIAQAIEKEQQLFKTDQLIIEAQNLSTTPNSDTTCPDNADSSQTTENKTPNNQENI